jgi:hypothetical protein
VAIGLAAFIAGRLLLDQRERAIAAGSIRVEATVVHVDQDLALLSWDAAQGRRFGSVRFNPSDIALERGDRREVLVDRDGPRRVHVPGNNIALVGETFAGLLRAAFLPLVGGVIAAVVTTSRWRRLRRALCEDVDTASTRLGPAPSWPPPSPGDAAQTAAESAMGRDTPRRARGGLDADR